jgi:hypothetical protein
MKLRLFAIRDTSTRELLPQTFSDKKAAKAERDLLNGSTSMRYVVTEGPDHRKFNNGKRR